jgi:hypothetical protein
MKGFSWIYFRTKTPHVFFDFNSTTKIFFDFRLIASLIDKAQSIIY